MERDQSFIFLVLGLPIAGLLYCGMIITLMISVPFVRAHPLGFGFLFFLIPFTIAAVTWLRASATAYRK